MATRHSWPTYDRAKSSLTWALGRGIDVLLSASAGRSSGKAYGLDMTPEMLEVARRNRTEAQVTDAGPRGDNGGSPLPDGSVDVVISNCVVENLPPTSPPSSRDLRVLDPGGRLAISDIVLRRALPNGSGRRHGPVDRLRAAGALLENAYREQLARAGFEEIGIEPTQVFDRGDIARMAGDLRRLGEVAGTLDVEATMTQQTGRS